MVTLVASIVASNSAVIERLCSVVSSAKVSRPLRLSLNLVDAAWAAFLRFCAFLRLPIRVEFYPNIQAGFSGATLGTGNQFLHVAIGMRYLPVLIGADTLRFKNDCLMADATGNRVVRGVFGFDYPAESFLKCVWADVISRRSLIVRFSHGEPLFILYTIVQMYVR